MNETLSLSFNQRKALRQLETNPAISATARHSSQAMDMLTRLKGLGLLQFDDDDAPLFAFLTDAGREAIR